MILKKYSVIYALICQYNSKKNQLESKRPSSPDHTTSLFIIGLVSSYFMDITSHLQEFEIQKWSPTMALASTFRKHLILLTIILIIKNKL